MELLKSNILIIVVFLVLTVTRPTFSRVSPGAHAEDPANEVYEIDYRGPETHSFIPPPDRSTGSPFVHHESVMAHHKLKDPRGRKIGN
ncbi:hypothetical protein FRX31_027847 [Thalictrum thalictroides]|uniref:Transmembrane protein n=1 Tax=Thalictrum thalictroides TaxID=46969 RepID=A0A7J6VE19_THATH|nr:hypothetical protein FRX31_027847 [Thalictrum thalictroides]